MKVRRGKVVRYYLQADTMPKHTADVLKTYFEALVKIEEQLPKVDKEFVEVRERARSKAQMTPAPPTEIFVVNEE